MTVAVDTAPSYSSKVADTRARIRNELARLVADGNVLLIEESIRQAPTDQQASLRAALHDAGFDKPKASAQSPTAPPEETRKPFNFGDEYQVWYTRSLRVVEQLLPDRYAEFRDLYRPERRKEIDVTTYGIADHIAGITVSRYGEPVFNAGAVAVSKLQSQIAILTSAQSRLDSILADIKGVLEASLFDDELSSARDLLKARHLRAAGIVAGVILERHLQSVLTNHRISFRKKATLANLNDALREGGVYDVPQWRQLQHLADIRNLCGHSGERVPTAEEVEGLIVGTEKTIRSVF